MFSLHIIDVVSTLPCGEIPIHYKRRNKLLKRDHESWFEPDSHPPALCHVVRFPSITSGETSF
jgi:hypothetical protein